LSFKVAVNPVSAPGRTLPRYPRNRRAACHGEVSEAWSSRPPAHDARNHLPAGSRQERFELLETIGRGGMAVVHAALDRASGRRVALKRLQAPRSEQLQTRNLEAFEREYHTLAQLAHPRVVEVYDFGVDLEGPHYTMELLDGGDIQQLGRVPWRRACEIARDVCSALSLLHSRRLVHRDVRPRNVRCTSDGRAKLIDFGAVAPVGPCKVLVGTPPCCAPESVQFQALDGRTDLFALGATLYFMLVGEHAYAARHVGSLQDAWLQGFARPSARVPDIPDALDELVLDLLRLQPDARPPAPRRWCSGWLASMVRRCPTSSTSRTSISRRRR